MFFCEPCRVVKNWPKSFSHSKGLCEICGSIANCYDVPSSQLSKPETPFEKAIGYRPREYTSPLLEQLAKEIDDEPLFAHYDPVTGYRNPKPSQVRIVAKSLIVSLNKLMAGEFTPSGKGAKAYHEANVARSLDFMVKHHHLLTRKLMPSGKKLYPKDKPLT